MRAFYSRRSKNLPSKKPRNTVKKQPTLVNNSPSIGSTIGQGVGIGAGAAMGNAMVNGMINTASESSNTNDKDTQTTFSCNQILESFQNCMYSHNDTVLCKPQLDLFNNCVQQNNDN